MIRPSLCVCFVSGAALLLNMCSCAPTIDMIAVRDREAAFSDFVPTDLRLDEPVTVQ